MTTIKRVLCALDGSEESVKSAILGARIASSLGAQLVCLYVIPYDLVFRLGIYRSEGEKELREEAECTMDRIAEATGTAFERVVEEGDPSESIIAEAEARSCDLIVLGSRGHGGVGRWLLGSVSAKVVDHAHCQVLVTRDLADVDTSEQNPFPAILCGIDGSIGSKQAAETVTQIARTFGSKLDFALVAEASGILGNPDVGADFLARQAHFSLESKKELSAMAQAAGVAPVFHDLAGHPAGELLKLARDSGAALIAVGSRGLGGFLGLNLGSTSHQVVRHAECSVLVCPEPRG